LADPAKYAGGPGIAPSPGMLRTEPHRHQGSPPPATTVAPISYASPASNTTPSGPGGYTCPMHPEVRSDRPGSCPKCGMALEPVLPATAPPATQWTCPMHPEIVRDAPGSCPICGMALEPRTITAEMTED